MIRYVASVDVAGAALEGGTVVLHMGTKRYYSLNESGAIVWQLAERQTTEEEATTRLLEVYHVSAADARAAVSELLSELVAEGLVVAQAE